jgi:hypothetical protein
MVHETAARNTARASVWTLQTELLTPQHLVDALIDRGFLPGITPVGQDDETQAGSTSDMWQIQVGGPGYHFASLSSSKGQGATVTVNTFAAGTELPGHQFGRTLSRRGGIVYSIEAHGPSNSDRSLCENLTEAIMEAVDGLAEISGRGQRGNKPSVYTSRWLGMYSN